LNKKEIHNCKQGKLLSIIPINSLIMKNIFNLLIFISLLILSSCGQSQKDIEYQQKSDSIQSIETNITADSMTDALNNLLEQDTFEDRTDTTILEKEENNI